MDVAARYGGDEFVLLLPQATASDAMSVAERIRAAYKPASAQLLKRSTSSRTPLRTGRKPAWPRQLFPLHSPVRPSHGRVRHPTD